MPAPRLMGRVQFMPVRIWRQLQMKNRHSCVWSVCHVSISHTQHLVQPLFFSICVKADVARECCLQLREH